ncbi:SAM-dependent methyltransferase [Pseudonocardia adelaidensis]|uniref:SAM-dependent methyltransferase n=1 Tax=Pseudonocardia adelaidensis TaxID=648754 RepID=A0ABP9P215_9PSEU
MPDQSSDPFVHTGIDTTVAHSARVWNYWLGGKDNYAVDREVGDAWMALYPEIVEKARESRAFLRRVVRFLAGEAGIRQFLDIGTGLPTADNTHEVAQGVAPGVRVVYVDNDPLVLAHARALLVGTPEGATQYLHADVRDVDELLRGAAEILDFTEPIAILMFGLLGHIKDTTEARTLVKRILAPMPSGSYLAIADGAPTERARVAEEEQVKKTGNIPYLNREPEEIASFFDGLEFLEPGFGSVSSWRPERPVGDVSVLTVAPPHVDEYGGLARKP